MEAMVVTCTPVCYADGSVPGPVRVTQVAEVAQAHLRGVTTVERMTGIQSVCSSQQASFMVRLLLWGLTTLASGIRSSTRHQTACQKRVECSFLNQLTHYSFMHASSRVRPRSFKSADLMMLGVGARVKAMRCAASGPVVQTPKGPKRAIDAGLGVNLDLTGNGVTPVVRIRPT
jgi:hypothetical protein